MSHLVDGSRVILTRLTYARELC